MTSHAADWLRAVQEGPTGAKREAYAGLLQAIREDRTADCPPLAPAFIAAFLADVREDGPWTARAFSCLGFFCRHHALVAATDEPHIKAVLDTVAHVLAHTPTKKNHSFAVWLLGVQKFATRVQEPLPDCGIARAQARAVQAMVQSVCGPPTAEALRPMALLSEDPRWKREDAQRVHSDVLSTVLALIETHEPLMAEYAALWVPYTMELLLEAESKAPKPLRCQAAAVLDRVLRRLRPPATPERLAAELALRLGRLYQGPLQHRLKATPLEAQQAMAVLGLVCLFNTRLQQRRSQEELNRTLGLLEKGLVHPDEAVRCQAVDAWRKLICNLGRVRKSQVAHLLMKPLQGPQVQAATPTLQAALYSAWCQLANIGLEQGDVYGVLVLEHFLEAVRASSHPGIQRQLVAYLCDALDPRVMEKDSHPQELSSQTQSQYIAADGSPRLAVPAVPRPYTAPEVTALLPPVLRCLAPTTAPAIPPPLAGPLLWPAVCRWVAAARPGRGLAVTPPPALLEAVEGLTEGRTILHDVDRVRLQRDALHAVLTAFFADADAASGGPWELAGFLRHFLEAGLRKMAQGLQLGPERPPQPPCLAAALAVMGEALGRLLAHRTPAEALLAEVGWLADVVDRTLLPLAQQPAVTLEVWQWAADSIREQLQAMGAHPASAAALRAHLRRPRNRQPVLRLLLLPLRLRGAGPPGPGNVPGPLPSVDLPALRHLMAASTLGPPCAAAWATLYAALRAAAAEPLSSQAAAGAPQDPTLEEEWCALALPAVEGLTAPEADGAPDSEAAAADGAEVLRRLAFMAYHVAGVAGGGQEGHSAVLRPVEDDEDPLYPEASVQPGHRPRQPLLVRLGPMLNALLRGAHRQFSVDKLARELRSDTADLAATAFHLLDRVLREVLHAPSLVALVDCLRVLVTVRDGFFALFKAYRAAATATNGKPSGAAPAAAAARVYALADRVFNATFLLLRSRPLLAILCGETLPGGPGRPRKVRRLSPSAAPNAAALHCLFQRIAPWLMACFHSQVLHVVNLAVTFWNDTFGALPAAIAPPLDAALAATLQQLARDTAVRLPPGLEAASAPPEGWPGLPGDAPRVELPVASQGMPALEEAPPVISAPTLAPRPFLSVAPAPAPAPTPAHAASAGAGTSPAAGAAGAEPGPAPRDAKRRLFEDEAAAYVVVDGPVPPRPALAAMTERQRQAWESRRLRMAQGLLSQPHTAGSTVLTPSLEAELQVDDSAAPQVPIAPTPTPAPAASPPPPPPTGLGDPMEAAEVTPAAEPPVLMVEDCVAETAGEGPGVDNPGIAPLGVPPSLEIDAGPAAAQTAAGPPPEPVTAQQLTVALAPFLADGGRGMARWSLGDLARAQAMVLQLANHLSILMCTHTDHHSSSC